VRLLVTSPKPYYNFLLEDPLPSCAEIINFKFATESSSANDRLIKRKHRTSDWRSSWPVIEYRDDRFIATQEYLNPGIHEFSYAIRLTLRGKARSPAAHAFLMYEPEISGRTRAGFLEVK